MENNKKLSSSFRPFHQKSTVSIKPTPWLNWPKENNSDCIFDKKLQISTIIIDNSCKTFIPDFPASKLTFPS